MSGCESMRVTGGAGGSKGLAGLVSLPVCFLQRYVRNRAGAATTTPCRFAAPALVAAVLAAAWGCSRPVLRSSELDDKAPEADAPEVPLVGDAVHPHGMNYVKVEGVSLVTNLDGTGEDPQPGAVRAALLSEMQRHGVARPAQLLASADTALVIVRAYLRPGLQKGDRFDVEVQLPSQNETVSLRGGWLLETRLTEIAMLGQQLRTGHLFGIAKGPVLVDPSAPPDSPRVKSGRVLSGGVARKSRSLGLSVDTPYRSLDTIKRIAAAVNGRFHTYVRGTRRGVASPKTDDYIELIVHPRYKGNVSRYMRVIRHIAFRETPDQRMRRLAVLERQLANPITSATAALRLEAVGEAAVDMLEAAARNADYEPEVRFYSAEALAYLDQTSAVETLAATARDDPALRLHAMAALSTLDDAVAYDALRGLLTSPSAETRYGAFRALSIMPSRDETLEGEMLGEAFSYHVLDIDGPPMIHVTRNHRPEIVLFGRDQRVKVPVLLDAGQHILIHAESPEEVVVSRFAPGERDQRLVVSNRVDDIIRAIVKSGGTYPDVVQALQKAKESQALTSRLQTDALPSPRPGGGTGLLDPPSAGAPFSLRNTLPDWFFRG